MRIPAASLREFAIIDLIIKKHSRPVLLIFHRKAIVFIQLDYSFFPELKEAPFSLFFHRCLLIADILQLPEL